MTKVTGLQFDPTFSLLQKDLLHKQADARLCDLEILGTHVPNVESHWILQKFPNVIHFGIFYEASQAIPFESPSKR